MFSSTVSSICEGAFRLDSSTVNAESGATNPTDAGSSKRIGVSRWYAGRIREGSRLHPRLWLALAHLVGVSPDV